MTGKPGSFKVTIDFWRDGECFTATEEFIATPEILAGGLSQAIQDAALKCHFDITAQKINKQRNQRFEV